MHRRKSKEKEKVYKVRFNGRYGVNDDQLNAAIAYRLLKFCGVKKNSSKSNLALNTEGYTIRRSGAIIDAKKIDFYWVYVHDYFIFKESPCCIVIQENECGNIWISYYRFKNESECEEFISHMEAQVANNNNPGREDLEHSNNRVSMGRQRSTTMSMEGTMEEVSEYTSLPSYRSRFTDHDASDAMKSPDSGPSDEYSVLGSCEKIPLFAPEEVPLEDVVKDFFTLDDARFENGDVSMNLDSYIRCGDVGNEDPHPIRDNHGIGKYSRHVSAISQASGVDKVAARERNPRKPRIQSEIGKESSSVLQEKSRRLSEH